jgi:hypothetical protein
METQKRVDVALAVEMVHMATSRHVDMIALLAGDRDFLPAVIAAKHAGVIVRLIHGEDGTVSEQLYQAVDERVEITKGYLEIRKIRYTISAKSAAKSVSDITSTPLGNGTPPSDIDEISRLFDRIITKNALKTGHKAIPATAFGIEIWKDTPDWAKKYRVKLLKDLVARVSDKVKWERIDNVDYISLVGDEAVPSHDGKENPVRVFLLEMLQQYFRSNPDRKSISAPDYGQLLTEKEKDWKKKFGTKSLTNALDLIKDKVSVSGNGPLMQIKFK